MKYKHTYHYYTKFFVIIAVLTLSFCAIRCKDSADSQKNTALYFSPIMEVPFDESMGKSAQEFKLILENSDDSYRYMKCKALYEKNRPSLIFSHNNIKIPKIIHQIWLGPKARPAYYMDFLQKWKSIHPEWDYHLWTESELEDLKLDNWDIAEKSNNWAEKADVIRCDLLDRFGGLYIDIDMDPHHCLDELHEKYDFYAGLEHPHKIATTTNRVWVGISIIASKAGHPIIKDWKRRIRNEWDEVTVQFSSQVERIINHTYFPFTHAVMQEIDRAENTDILFPATYFYPISPSYAAKRKSSFRAIREKIYEFLENIHLRSPRAFSRSYPETLAIHYWGNSWLPNSLQQVQQMQITVDEARKDIYTLQQREKALEHMLRSHEEKIQQLQQSYGQQHGDKLNSSSSDACSKKAARDTYLNNN